MSRIRVALMALVLLAAFVVAGCGSSDDSSTDSASTGASSTADSTTETPAPEGSGLTVESDGSEVSSETTKGPGGGISGKSIYLVAPGAANPWTGAFSETLVNELEGAEADVTFLSDPLDVQVETENFNRAVAANPDMIVMMSLDQESLLPGVTRAHAAGIAVFNTANHFVSAEEQGLLSASIEANHPKLGEFAAENLIEGLEQQGKKEANIIAITGFKGSSQVEDRKAGFERKLEESPSVKMNLVAVEDGKWDQATSQALAQQLFAQYQAKGGIQGAYGMADNQALGIVQAAKDAGMAVGGKDGLIVTGSNCYQAGLESVENGEMFGTATQSPVEEAEVTAGRILEYWEGDEIPVRTLVPEFRVTDKNVQEILQKKVCP